MMSNDSREIELRETHFCSISAVESGSISPESLLVESCSHIEPDDSQDQSSVHSLYDDVDLVFNKDCGNESKDGDTTFKMNSS